MQNVFPGQDGAQQPQDPHFHLMQSNPHHPNVPLEPVKKISSKNRKPSNASSTQINKADLLKNLQTPGVKHEKSGSSIGGSEAGANALLKVKPTTPNNPKNVAPHQQGRDSPQQVTEVVIDKENIEPPTPRAFPPGPAKQDAESTNQQMPTGKALSRSSHKHVLEVAGNEGGDDIRKRDLKNTAQANVEPTVSSSARGSPIIANKDAAQRDVVQRADTDSKKSIGSNLSQKKWKSATKQIIDAKSDSSRGAPVQKRTYGQSTKPVTDARTTVGGRQSLLDANMFKSGKVSGNVESALFEGNRGRVRQTVVPKGMDNDALFEQGQDKTTNNLNNVLHRASIVSPDGDDTRDAMNRDVEVIGSKICFLKDLDGDGSAPRALEKLDIPIVLNISPYQVYQIDPLKESFVMMYKLEMKMELPLADWNIKIDRNTHLDRKKPLAECPFQFPRCLSTRY